MVAIYFIIGFLIAAFLTDYDGAAWPPFVLIVVCWPLILAMAGKHS